MGNFLQPRLHLKVSQKQILTPGLVQMVSVLALNRLELREMITQEMVANPMLEEYEDQTLEQEAPEEVSESAGTEEPVASDDGQGDKASADGEGAEASSEAIVETSGEDVGFREIQEVIRETMSKEAAEGEPANPFDEFDANAFLSQYLDTGGESPRDREEIEKPSFETFLSSPQQLADHLQWQLRASICSEQVREIAEAIIGNLDEDGYLTATLEEIAQSGPYEMDDVEEALAVVQEMDPPGVAARNLRECLLIQLKTIAPNDTLACQVVSECLPSKAAAADADPDNPESPLVKQFQNNQLREIARALGRPVESVMRAVEVIKRLDPRPGLRYNHTEARVVEPDVYFRKEEGEWRVFMNDDGLPQLRLSPIYRRLLARDSAEKDVRNYVKEKFNAALQLLKNIEQRKHTIQRVCQTIIRRQGEFLDHGADHLKPLMIKEVAEEVGVHPSTVSRAVASKYAHTPQGVIELRSFFSESVNGPGGTDVSLQTLKRRVKKMIEEEDTGKPLTDEQIAKRLDDEGIHVTRRTVAKYREDMRIPSTHQRRVKA